MSFGFLTFIVLSLLLLDHRVSAEKTTSGQGNHNDLIGDVERTMSSCERIPVESRGIEVASPFRLVSTTSAVPNYKAYQESSNDCSLTSSRVSSFRFTGNWVNGNWKRRSMSATADQFGVFPAGSSFQKLIIARDDEEQADVGDEKSSWNTLQLITPVIVGIAVAAVMLTLFVLYRRGIFSTMFPKIGEFFAKLYRNGFGKRKVRKTHRHQSWVIDRPMETLELNPSPPSSGGGHVRLNSSTSDVSNHLDFPPSKNKKAIWVMPGKKLWQNSTLVQKTRRVMLMIPLPWKNAVKPVKNKIPGRRFEIDGSNQSTRTDSTLTNYRQAGFRMSAVPSHTTESSGPSTAHFVYTDIQTEPIYEEDESSDTSSDLELGSRNAPMTDFEEDDETENLISPSFASFNAEHDVMVISASGGTLSSSEHGLRIIPSSHGSDTDTFAKQDQSPENTTVQPPSALLIGRVPPAPNYPAPVPPPPSSSSPRSPARRLQKPSIESIIQQPLVGLPASSRQPDYFSIPPPPPLPAPVHTPIPAPARTPIPLPPPPSLQTQIPPPPLLPSRLALPSFEPPTPLYTRRNPSESAVSLHSNGNGPYQPAPLSAIPEVNRLLHQQSVESIANRPLQGVHQRTESSSTSSLSIPQMCSPPYRSSPLPQEILIARSESPPPPLTPSANSTLLLGTTTATSPRSRPLPLPGNAVTTGQPQHRRIFSADSVPVPAGQLQVDNYPYSLADRNAARLSFSDAYPTPLSHTRNLSSDNVEQYGHAEHPALLFPGPVRAAGYLQGGNMSSDSLYLRDGVRREEPGAGRGVRNEESFIA